MRSYRCLPWSRKAVPRVCGEQGQAKYRKRILEDRYLARMHSVCIRVAEKSSFQLLEFNREPNHIHLLIEHSPATPVSQLVNQIKGVTSRVLRKEFGFQGEHLAPFWWRGR